MRVPVLNYTATLDCFHQKKSPEPVFGSGLMPFILGAAVMRR